MSEEIGILPQIKQCYVAPVSNRNRANCNRYIQIQMINQNFVILVPRASVDLSLNLWRFHYTETLNHSVV